MGNEDYADVLVKAQLRVSVISCLEIGALAMFCATISWKHWSSMEQRAWFSNSPFFLFDYMSGGLFWYVPSTLRYGNYLGSCKVIVSLPN